VLGGLVVDEHAQISVEMIIVLAAVVVVVLLFASKLFATSERSAEKLEEKADQLLKQIDKFSKQIK
jgi:competence protein ComGC